MKEQMKEQEELTKNESETNEPKELGMKWFKFLIYFSLWAGALLNLVDGIIQITGNIYLSEGINPDLVYKKFPNLKSVDVFFGILFCIFAIFQIVVRFKLSKFSKLAPTMLHVMYILGGILSLIYGIIVVSMIGGNEFGQILGEIGGTVVITLMNIKYFNKRKHLFVN